METQPDFRALLALFNAHNVEYLIVGGYALGFHGAPRFTGDLDIFVKSDAVNAQHILTALADFGFASVGLTPSDFDRPDQVVQLGVPPVRIDLITSITGVSWDEAWTGRIAGRYGDIPANHIGPRAVHSQQTSYGKSERRGRPGIAWRSVKSKIPPAPIVRIKAHPARSRSCQFKSVPHPFLIFKFK